MEEHWKELSWCMQNAAANRGVQQFGAAHWSSGAVRMAQRLDAHSHTPQHSHDVQVLRRSYRPTSPSGLAQAPAHELSVASRYRPSGQRPTFPHTHSTNRNRRQFHRASNPRRVERARCCDDGHCVMINGEASPEAAPRNRAVGNQSRSPATLNPGRKLPRCLRSGCALPRYVGTMYGVSSAGHIAMHANAGTFRCPDTELPILSSQ